VRGLDGSPGQGRVEPPEVCPVTERTAKTPGRSRGWRARSLPMTRIEGGVSVETRDGRREACPGRRRCRTARGVPRPLPVGENPGRGRWRTATRPVYGERNDERRGVDRGRPDSYNSVINYVMTGRWDLVYFREKPAKNTLFGL